MDDTSAARSPRGREVRRGPHPLRDLREAGSRAREFFLDWRRSVRWGTPAEGRIHADDAPIRLEAQIRKDAHRLEKGLAVHEPRRPFGDGPAERLEALLPAFAPDPGAPPVGPPPVHPVGTTAEPTFVRHAREAMAARDRWNAGGDRDSSGAAYVAGDWEGLEPSLLADFFGSRYSVRDFDLARRVTADEVRAAVALAQRTPSVCNRQAARVHAYLEQSDVRALLALHTGSAGFTDRIAHLAVVTVDPRLMTGAGERNQGWIDGGLFAMSLVWAFHGLGIGTCMLNWSRLNADSDRLRAVAGIPGHEDVVVLVAFGHPATGSRRTRSERRPLSEVLTMHHQSEEVNP